MPGIDWYETRPIMSNRDVRLKPKRGKFWCDHCDAALVSDGGRCPRCKRKTVKKRFKK